MKNDIESVKTLGKEAIIQQGYSILHEKYPGIDIKRQEFEIKVWANSTKVEVVFKRLVRYVPLGKSESDLTYDLTINMLNNEVAPLDYWPDQEFYTLHGKDKENYDFVVSHFGLPVSGFRNTIYEQEDAYHISLQNKVAFGKYFIDKTTGKEKEPPMQGSYAPMPEVPGLEADTDRLVEITE